MWRRPLLLALLVIVAAILVALLAGRGTAHFQDAFDDAAASQDQWRILGGGGAVEETDGRSALLLTGEAADRCVVALADSGRLYRVDGLTIKAEVRVESGLGGMVFGLQNADRLIGYRLEVDPEAHRGTVYERRAEGPEFDIHTYRDGRINPGTWCRLTLASTEEQFIVFAAFGEEQPREIIRDAQDHEHPGRQAFEQGRVGLYALGGEAWFDNVSVQGAPAGNHEEAETR